MVSRRWLTPASEGAGGGSRPGVPETGSIDIPAELTMTTPMHSRASAQRKTICPGRSMGLDIGRPTRAASGSQTFIQSQGAEHPVAYFCRKHVKSATLRTGAAVLPSQLAEGSADAYFWRKQVKS